VHVEELICLAEPIPCTVILTIHVHSTAICFDCCVGIFHLDILMTHERPGGEVRSVELRSTPEVPDGLFMFCSQ
jgi:hypothetical protein